MNEPIKFDSYVLVMLPHDIIYGYKQLVFKDELRDKMSTLNNNVSFQWQHTVLKL